MDQVVKHRFPAPGWGCLTISSAPGWGFRIDLTPHPGQILTISRGGGGRGTLGQLIAGCIKCTATWLLIEKSIQFQEELAPHIFFALSYKVKNKIQSVLVRNSGDHVEVC